MIQIMPCMPEHLRQIDSLSSPADRELTLAHVDDTPEIDRVLEVFARTLVADFKPIACFGVWPMWPGVARAWSDLSAEALALPKALHGSVREELGKIVEQAGLRRVEAVVDEEHVAGHRWMEHLGFTSEAVMENYGVGGVGAYRLYSRLF
jgi:hypothetical protein